MSTIVGSNCYIDPNTQLGEDCVIGNNTMIYGQVRIGNHVTIGPNSIIGNAPTCFGLEESDERFETPLIIEDNVFIGNLCVIERGVDCPSKIGRGSMIGSLCYLAHEFDCGTGCFIYSHCFFCGRVKLGNGVLVLSNVTMFDKVSCGDNTIVFHRAIVSKSCEPRSFIIGERGEALKEYRKRERYIRRLAKYEERLKILEDRINGRIDKRFAGAVPAGESGC